MPVIAIEALTKCYRRKRTVVRALTDLDLAIAPGEVFGFLGPNGAGKSTTIKVLMGLISATSGRAALCGYPVSDLRSRRHVGYLPENPVPYDFLTAREFLGFIGRSHGVEARLLEQRIVAVLERLALTEAAKRPIRGFSKGMVQRLALGASMLHDPELYILDEPMSGLDPLGRALVKELILELKGRGKTIFFSTHITADVEAVCDRVGVLVKGRLEGLNAVREIVQGEKGRHRLTVRRGDAVAILECDADELLPRLQGLGQEGATVERIEPVQQTIEQYFLDIIARADRDHGR